MDYLKRCSLRFFVGLHTKSQEKIVKKLQILGCVTILVTFAVGYIKNVENEQER